MKRLVLLWLVSMCLGPVGAAEESIEAVSGLIVPTLVVGHWPPYINQAKPEQGLLTQEVLAIYRSVGIEPLLRYRSWAEVVNEGVKQANQLSFGWVLNDERQKHWLFSEPVYQSVIGLWVRNDFNQIVNDYQDLDSYLVGVGKHYSYGQSFEDNKNRFRRAEFVQEGEGFRLLVAGRIDVFIGDQAVGEYFLSRHKDWRERVYFLETSILDKAGLHMVCSKNNIECKQHLSLFNQALRAYKLEQ